MWSTAREVVAVDTLCASPAPVETFEAVLADPDLLREEFDALIAASCPDAPDEAAPPQPPVAVVAVAAPPPGWTPPGPGQRQLGGTSDVLRARFAFWRRQRSPPHVG